MRILLVTDTQDLSGAGIAARRLGDALRSINVESRMAVARGNGEPAGSVQLNGRMGRLCHGARRAIARLVLVGLGAGRNDTLSANMLPTGVHRRINASDADVVHLHWIGSEMIRVEEIAHIRAPLVWTLHDEWFARGLEHYGSDARNSEVVSPAGTGIRGRALRRLDDWTRSRKRRAWVAANIRPVAPSRWLADTVVRSGATCGAAVPVIPNPVPLDVFRPADRLEARLALGLPTDRPVIGFGALRSTDDPRKGYRLLTAALRQLDERTAAAKPVLLVFGAERGSRDDPWEARYTGTLRGDRELASIYPAMDVFVCPSKQDNLPNTVAEALACGTPCVAFRVGGLSDLIKHGSNGYLAHPFDVGDLCRGILDCLDTGRAAGYSLAAREFAERTLAPARIASRYLEIYRSVAGAASLPS